MACAVIIDNTWLWRADHTVNGLVYNYSNPVFNGLVVTGNDVIAYGLAVEHTLADLVAWTGGATSRAVLPIDVGQSWSC